MPKKEAKVQVRISQDLRDRLDGAVESTGVPEPVIVARCLEAYCDYVEANGEATFPLIVKPKSDELAAAVPVHSLKAPPKRKVASRWDIREVSLAIFSTIPAGWPDHRRAIKPLRTVMVRKGTYPTSAFGLDVTGDSMNTATGKFGPVLPGETVVLTPFTSADEASGKIVAAMIDGHTTLKRLVCPKGGDCYLRPESSNPAFAGKMHPMHELEVQGVVVGKL